MSINYDEYKQEASRLDNVILLAESERRKLEDARVKSIVPFTPRQTVKIILKSDLKPRYWQTASKRYPKGTELDVYISYTILTKTGKSVSVGMRVENSSYNINSSRFTVV